MTKVRRISGLHVDKISFRPKTFFWFTLWSSSFFFSFRVSIIWNVTQHEWFIEMRFLFAVFGIHSWNRFLVTKPTAVATQLYYSLPLRWSMWTKQKRRANKRRKKNEATTNQSHCQRMNVVYVKYIYMCVTLRWTMVKNWFSFISDNLIIFPQNLNKEAGSL